MGRLLVRGGGVQRMDAAGSVLPRGFVLVDGSRIVAVGPLEEAPAASEVNEVIDASGCWVVPGLMNLHQHHWYHLLKGMSEGLYLEDWVGQVLGPASEALTDEELLASVRLAAADMLLTGTTLFFNHSVTETDEALVGALGEVSRRTGIRHVFGKELHANPTRCSPHDHREQARRLVKGYPLRADSTFAVALAIETGEHWLASGTMTTEIAQFVVDVVGAHRVLVSDHVTGGTLFRTVADFRRRTGSGEVHWLARHGLLSPYTLLVHAVWIGDDEILAAARAGATVVTCPSSSAFTAGGIPPLRTFLDTGLNVAAGSDGPMVNDSVDMLGQLRECFLLQNARYLAPAAVPTSALWTMVTRNAARALGLEGQLGEITPGAAADIAIFDLTAPRYGAALNPPANLVLSGGGHEARWVVVGGEVVKDPGGLRTLDLAEVVTESRELARRLAGRAGLLPQRRGK